MFGLSGMWKKCGVLIFVLVIGACTGSPPVIQEPPKRYYIVKGNDNFHSIAFAFELSFEQLHQANRWLDPDRIAPGMRLVIPRPYSDQNLTVKDRFIWPLDRLDVSSGFGYRGGDLHSGVDLRAPRGTSIYAAADGRVVFSGRKRGYGLMLIIEHGGGIETVYAHNDQNIVEVGHQVRQGQVIGMVGRSGNATGYHVHFEIRRLGKAVNPTSFVNAEL